MLHKLISVIRDVHHLSGFQGYLQKVQDNSISGGPTAREARRDYLTGYGVSSKTRELI